MAKNSNPIGTLQEICQQWKLTLPVYREAEGSYQEFGTEVTVILAGETLGFHALGRTKKVSKANAAQRVLEFIAQYTPRYLQPPPLPVCLTSKLEIKFSCFFLQTLDPSSLAARGYREVVSCCCMITNELFLFLSL